MKYFFTYKTANRINGKTYYGNHNTHNLEDGYLGSGVRFSRAVKQYEAKNSTREILSFYPDRESIVAAEKALITKDVVKSKNTYNAALSDHGRNIGPIVNAKIGKAMSEALLGKPKSGKHKQAIRESKLGIPRSKETSEKIASNWANKSSDELNAFSEKCPL